MVNKKTMSVHNSAHLFIVNTADVPLTYRSPSAPQVFFFFFSFRLSTKRIELHFDHRLFHSVFKNKTWRKSNKSTLILSGIAPKSSGRESLKYYTHNYTTGLSHILIT